MLVMLSLTAGRLTRVAVCWGAAGPTGRVSGQGALVRRVSSVSVTPADALHGAGRPVGARAILIYRDISVAERGRRCMAA